MTMAPDMWLPNSPDLNPVDYAIWSVIQLNAAGNILTVHYKDTKCDVSFTLGSVSTLFSSDPFILLNKPFIHSFS